MSRLAKKPIKIPSGVKIVIDDKKVTASGASGSLQLDLYEGIKVVLEENEKDKVLKILSSTQELKIYAMLGTTCALLRNMVIGVSEGFEKKLLLVGVGYRVKLVGKVLELSLGFSHPVKYNIPEGISIETPSATEIIIKGASKVLVGQTAAEIRRFRPPDSYKGKGVRYSDEKIILKEVKKK